MLTVNPTPPARPDSATFWRDKRVITTGGSGDPLDPIGTPSGLDGRTKWKLPL